MKVTIDFFIRIFFLIPCADLSAQGMDTSIVYNQVNSAGKKEGYWKITMHDNNSTYIYAVESYKNDTLDGLSTYFFPNGSTRSEHWYKNGKLNGESKIYRADGGLYIVEHFKYGRTHGIKQYYNHKNKLITEDEYDNGVRNGKSKTYYSGSGYLQTETTIVNDVEEGIRKVYSDDSQHELIREFDFKTGVCIAARYYKKGKVVKEEKFDYQEQLKKNEETKKGLPID